MRSPWRPLIGPYVMQQSDSLIFRVARLVFLLAIVPAILVQVAHGVFSSWKSGTSTFPQWLGAAIIFACCLCLYSLAAVAVLKRRRARRAA